eukprot:4279595-Pyramimonas_sp.AAC.1
MLAETASESSGAFVCCIEMPELGLLLEMPQLGPSFFHVSRSAVRKELYEDSVVPWLTVCRRF